MGKLDANIIYGFTGSLLSGQFDEPAPTPECHREWWDLCCSIHRYVAIAAPRGHAKSTAITKAYTLASVLFREHDYVIVVSDTYKQAVQFLGEIKRELSVNEDLRLAFGITREFDTDREDEIVVTLSDGYQFKIAAMGSEQKIRGMLWNNKRPNLIIGDDLENDEIVQNPDRREKFRHWFFNALVPCLSRRGKVRLVGTILHMDALLERVMPRDHDKNTVITPLKVFMLAPTNGWMSVRYCGHDEKFEHILWPTKWPEERFREQQRLFQSQGNPEGYYQEYLNRPIDPENAFFKKEDFVDFDEVDLKRDWSYAPTYLSCDLAVSTKDRRDWCAFGIGSVDDVGQLYLRHVIRDRLDPKEQIDIICRLHDRFKFSIILIGKGALEKSIGPFLREALRKRGKFVHIETIPESIDKRLRAQSIRGRMRSGGVKINKREPWYIEFEQELKVFDRGTYNDQVDMMSLFGMYLDNIIEAPTPKEQAMMEWEEQHDPTMFDQLNLGKSRITGY